jgi:pimeloyl-ACP methyl ester carboxylesterase
MEVDVHGLRIAYEREGSGPPVVLLHGWVGDGLGTWRDQIADLSDDFTVIAWDNPGAGRSADPPESFSLADFADCLAEFIHAIGVERPHVVGLSYGGGLAIQLYGNYPAIPASLVLAGAYAGWGGSLPPDVVRERLQLALELTDLGPEPLTKAMMPTMFSDLAPPHVVDAFAATVAAFHPVGARAIARAFAEADLRDVLPKIEIPTLLLYGDKDIRAPLDVAEMIHTAIPDSKLVILEGVGHVSSVQAPERFNAEVRSFLSTLHS